MVKDRVIADLRLSPCFRHAFAMLRALLRHDSPAEVNFQQGHLVKVRKLDLDEAGAPPG